MGRSDSFAFGSVRIIIRALYCSWGKLPVNNASVARKDVQDVCAAIRGPKWSLRLIHYSIPSIYPT